MSTTTFSPTTSPATSPTTRAATSPTRATEHAEDRTRGRVSWTRGLATGALAAVVVTAVAGAFQAAGHRLSLVDGPLPLASFGQMVLLSTVVGILIARHTSRTTFYRVTVALTALSCVPDLAWGDGAVSKAGLVLTHVLAAAIIVPRLARR